MMRGDGGGGQFVDGGESGLFGHHGNGFSTRGEGVGV